MRTGRSPDDFWRQTPYTISLAIQAHNEALTEENKRVLFAAWHTAAFTRAKELPDLKRLLTMSGPDEDDGDLEGQLMAWVHSHNARYEARKRMGLVEE